MQLAYVHAYVQVRNYFDVTGSVKQMLKELNLETLNLILLPADGNMDTIAVSAANHKSAVLCAPGHSSACMHEQEHILQCAQGLLRSCMDMH